MKNIEKIEKEQKTKLDRLELSIKTAEANSRQNRDLFNRLKRSKTETSCIEYRRDGVFENDKVPTFLDRQIEGYRKTLKLLSHRGESDDPFILMNDNTPQSTFDAYFPPLNKTAKKAAKKDFYPNKVD